MVNVSNFSCPCTSIGRGHACLCFAGGMGRIFQPGGRYRTARCQSPKANGDMEKDVLVEKLAALNSHW
jgi:hypothetical protein